MNMPAMRSEASLGHAGSGVYRGTDRRDDGRPMGVTVTVTRGSQRLGTRQMTHHGAVRRTAMIERLIDWCARNRVLVFIGGARAVGLGRWAMLHTPLDAVPDISDVQVIVSTEWMGRSPDLVEDQITYPIVTRADLDAAASRPCAASPSSACRSST